MLNKITSIILLTALTTLVWADIVQVNPDHPEQYTVQKGDTLWGISGQFLQEPWRWPEVWNANQHIENPHLIYPGDIISLSYEDGSPVLSVNRGGVAQTNSKTGSRVVKLSPTVRSHEKDEAIPSIPIDVIRHFLSRPTVVDKNEMRNWPYVVSSYEQHLVAGPGNKVYIKGLDANSNTTEYSVYREGPAYYSKPNQRGKILGYESIYVGEVVIEKFGELSSGIVVQAEREMLNGDRLISQSEKDISSDFIPRSPDNAVNGSIISVVDGLSQIGQYQIVVLDLGKSSGVEIGNVLGVYQSGNVVTDNVKNKKGNIFTDSGLVNYLGKPKAKGKKVHMPEEYTGVLMVFRTYDQISYALVMETLAPLHLYDTVKNM